MHEAQPIHTRWLHASSTFVSAWWHTPTFYSHRAHQMPQAISFMSYVVVEHRHFQYYKSMWCESLHPHTEVDCTTMTKDGSHRRPRRCSKDTWVLDCQGQATM